MIRCWSIRLVLTAGLLLLTACDGYVEQVTVTADGDVSFAARATVVCTDELQQLLWGGDPCPKIDSAARGAPVEDLPLDFAFDTARTALVATGEGDRRVVDVTWEGRVEELESVLVSGGRLEQLDELTSRLSLTTAGAPALRVIDGRDTGLDAAFVRSRWPAAELRVVAPALVTDHNGDDIQGRTVIWAFDGDLPDTLTVTWSTEERGFRVWWWLVGAVILAVVLMMMVVLEGPRLEGADADDDAS